MFEVNVSRNGSVVHNFKCRAVCIAYDDGTKVSTVVSADPDVDVLDMTILGCSAATSALRASTVTSSTSKEDDERTRTDVSVDNDFSEVPDVPPQPKSVVEFMY